VDQAWDYFNNEQAKEQQYEPMISADDMPPTYLNHGKQEQFRDELSKFYYDETKYDSYLEQLGIEYPTVRQK
jgi:aminobenzoyl-glutamate utilization protein B